MAKESLYTPQKAPIFKETFVSEQTTRTIGGVPTSVTYTSGVGSFNGTSSTLKYNKNFKFTGSVRFKLKSYVPATFEYLCDFRSPGGSGYIFAASATGLSSSSGTIYVDGVASGVVSVNTKEIVVTGLVIDCQAYFNLMSTTGPGAYSEGSLELFEIYDYTLTANEVANLYNNKRNRDLNVYQQDSDVSWRGSGVTGNYCSTPNAAANQITGNIDFIAYVNYTDTGTYQMVFSKNSGVPASFSYEFYFNGIGSSNNLEIAYSNGSSYFGNQDTYTFPSSFKGWVRATRNTTTGVVEFFRSSDAVTTSIASINWTLNSSLIRATGNFQNSSSILSLGQRATGTAYPFQGKIYRATISNTIGGTPVVDFNPQLQTPNTTSWVSVTGETWTVNGSAKVTNIDRQEILNIDAKNGVIANKYNPENLLKYSEDLTNASWVKLNTTITPNTNQYLGRNFDTLVETTANGFHQVGADLASNLAVTYIFSGIIKINPNLNRNIIIIPVNSSGAGSNKGIVIDKNGNFIQMIGSTGADIVYSLKVENGFIYFSAIGIATAAGYLFGPTIRLAIGTTTTYTGDTNEFIEISSCQLNTETLKPYIKTTTTTINSTLINTSVVPVKSGSIYAMGFNGTSSKLDCGNYDSLVGDKTFIIWVKIRKLLTSARIIDNDRFLFIVNVSGTVGVCSAASTQAATVVIIKQGNWYMLVATRTSTGLASIYANGVAQITNQNSDTPVAGITNIFIGNKANGLGPIDGQLSAPRIIDGILSAQEISALFSSERKNYNV